MRDSLFSDILLSFDDYKMVLFVVITKSEREGEKRARISLLCTEKFLNHAPIICR